MCQHPLRTITYTYDLADRRTQVTHHDGNAFAYDYNPDGSLLRVRQGGSTIASYSYDNRSRPSAIANGNATSESRSFDGISRLASRSLDLLGSSSDTTSSFSYNPASQIHSATLSNDAYAYGAEPASTRSYAADTLNQNFGDSILSSIDSRRYRSLQFSVPSAYRRRNFPAI